MISSIISTNSNITGLLMTKFELIEALAEQHNLSIKNAKSIVATILETMASAMVRGERVEIRGFGSFGVRDYESYTGRKPRTGEAITVAPKKLPFFKPSMELREQVNDGYKKKY